jgi:hexosaminidase
MWAERTPELKHVDYQTWPRLSALAEVAWSNPQGRSFNEFLPRLDVHAARLKRMNVHHGPTTRPSDG